MQAERSAGLASPRSDNAIGREGFSQTTAERASREKREETREQDTAVAAVASLPSSHPACLLFRMREVMLKEILSNCRMPRATEARQRRRRRRRWHAAPLLSAQHLRSTTGTATVHSRDTMFFISLFVNNSLRASVGVASQQRQHKSTTNVACPSASYPSFIILLGVLRFHIWPVALHSLIPGPGLGRGVRVPLGGRLLVSGIVSHKVRHKSPWCGPAAIKDERSARKERLSSHHSWARRFLAGLEQRRARNDGDSFGCVTMGLNRFSSAVIRLRPSRPERAQAVYPEKADRRRMDVKDEGGTGTSGRRGTSVRYERVKQETCQAG